MDYTKIKVGDRLKILSWPRQGDGADGFAGTIGTVEQISYDEKFEYHRIGSIAIKTDNGATLVGCGINRMKFEILT